MTQHHTPSMSLLVKLGSIAVHADEFASHGGHDFDRQSVLSLMADPEVKAWLAAMDADSFLPVRRDGLRYKNPV